MIWWDIVLRIVVAMLLGGLIGFQREFQNNSAGLRTHALVAIGACVTMITNEFLFVQYSGQSSMDVARMGSYVISGIGFLGAGSIIKDGNRIRGLTTAAGLWVVACIGVAVGAGYYYIAMVATVLVFFVIFILKIVEVKMFSSKNSIKIELELPHHTEHLADVMASISKCDVVIKDIQIINLDRVRKNVIIYTSITGNENIPNLTKALMIDDIIILSISHD